MCLFAEWNFAGWQVVEERLKETEGNVEETAPRTNQRVIFHLLRTEESSIHRSR